MTANKDRSTKATRALKPHEVRVWTHGISEVAPSYAEAVRMVRRAGRWADAEYIWVEGTSATGDSGEMCLRASCENAWYTLDDVRDLRHI